MQPASVLRVHADQQLDRNRHLGQNCFLILALSTVLLAVHWQEESKEPVRVEGSFEETKCDAAVPDAAIWPAHEYHKQHPIFVVDYYRIFINQHDGTDARVWTCSSVLCHVVGLTSINTVCIDTLQ